MTPLSRTLLITVAAVLLVTGLILTVHRNPYATTAIIVGNIALGVYIGIGMNRRSRP